MNSQVPSKDQFVSVPFYIFITLLLGTLGWLGGQSVAVGNPAAIIGLFGALMLSHIGLYWLNLRFYADLRWQVGYYLGQTLLIWAITMLPYSSDINVMILSSCSICMIGEALGMWGNSRKALGLGVGYFGFVLIMFKILIAPEQLFAAISAFLVNGGYIILFLLVLNQQLRERHKAEELAETLESANAKLAASAAKIAALTLQNERQRMARELHDTLAQGVTGLILQLEASKAHLAANRPERAAAIVDQALSRARSTLAEARAAIDDLRAAPENLASEIRHRVEQFRQTSGTSCDLDLTLQEPQLLPESANHALHILSEALANVSRHARARHVRVQWTQIEQRLTLAICDDGVGFQLGAPAEGHYGLLGMHERARLIGGRLQIETAPDRGTCVRFELGERA